MSVQCHEIYDLASSFGREARISDKGAVLVLKSKVTKGHDSEVAGPWIPTYQNLYIPRGVDI